MVTRLTIREKTISIIEKRENITIIFGVSKKDKKQVMCNKCKADMNEFIKIDECIEFECGYCGKNVKIPESCWDEDIYSFPNQYYTVVTPIHARAQSLAQAYRKLRDLGVE